MRAASTEQRRGRRSHLRREEPREAIRGSRHRAREWFLALLALLLPACSGLSRLPTGPSAPAPGGPAQSPEQLWAGLTADNPLPERTESAYRSTTRMVIGDLGNKRRAQKAATACRSDPPPGFSEVSGVEMAGGEAPLHAYLHHGAPDRPWVIVLHGLYDSRNSLYVQRLATALSDRGFGVLVPDQRWHGCLLSEKWLPGLGVLEARDLAAWSRWLRQLDDAPDRPVALVGFSLGGLSVIHALASEEAEESFRAGGVALSPPAALARLLPSLDRPTYLSDRGLLKIIDKGFRMLMKKRVRDQGIPLTPELDDRPFTAVLQHMSTRLFPANPAVASTDAILRFTDPASRIAGARRPLLLLTTRNDPLFGTLVANELTAAADGHPMAHVIETPYGGHIGQLGLYPEWTLEVLLRFLTQAERVAAP